MADYIKMNRADQRRYFAKLYRKNFAPIPFRGSLSLGALNTNTVIKADMLDTVLGEDIFFISCDITCGIREQTPTEGPIEFGLAHGDYDVGEIEEALSVSYFNPDNKIEQERSKRLVRRIGLFPGLRSEETFNQGAKYRQIIKFSVGNGFNLDYWAANRSSAALTTGTVIEFAGTLFGKWQR